MNYCKHVIRLVFIIKYEIEYQLISKSPENVSFMNTLIYHCTLLIECAVSELPWHSTF